MSQQQADIEKELNRTKLSLSEAQKKVAILEANNATLIKSISANDITNKSTRTTLDKVTEDYKKTTRELTQITEANKLLEDQNKQLIDRIESLKTELLKRETLFIKRDSQFENLIRRLGSEDCLDLQSSHKSTPMTTPMKARTRAVSNIDLDSNGIRSSAAIDNTGLAPITSTAFSQASALAATPTKNKQSTPAEQSKENEENLSHLNNPYGQNDDLEVNVTACSESQLLNYVEDTIVATVKNIRRKNQQLKKKYHDYLELKIYQETLKTELDSLKNSTIDSIKTLQFESTQSIRLTKEKLDRYIADKQKETEDNLSEVNLKFQQKFDEHLKRSKTEIDKLKNRIAELQTEIQQKDNSLSLLTRKIADKEKYYTNQITELDGSLKASELRAESLQNQLRVNKSTKIDIQHAFKSKEEELKRNVELLEKKLESENRLIKNLQAQLEANRKDLSDARQLNDSLNEMRLTNERKHTTEIASFKQQLSDFDSKSLDIDKLTKKYDDKIAELQEKNKSSIEIITKLESKLTITQMNASADNKRVSEKELVVRLTEMETQHQNELDKMAAQHKNELNEMAAQHKREIEKIISNHQNEVSLLERLANIKDNTLIMQLRKHYQEISDKQADELIREHKAVQQAAILENHKLKLEITGLKRMNASIKHSRDNTNDINEINNKEPVERLAITQVPQGSAANISIIENSAAKISTNEANVAQNTRLQMAREQAEKLKEVAHSNQPASQTPPILIQSTPIRLNPSAIIQHTPVITQSQSTSAHSASVQSAPVQSTSVERISGTQHFTSTTAIAQGINPIQPDPILVRQSSQNNIADDINQASSLQTTNSPDVRIPRYSERDRSG